MTPLFSTTLYNYKSTVSVTNRQLHMGYTSREKRIIPSGSTNGCIDEDLKLRKEEEDKGGKGELYTQ